MQQFILVLTLLPLNHSYLQSLSNDTVLEELKKYFATYKHYTSINYTSCSYINVHLPHTSHISSWLIKHNECPSLTATAFMEIPEYVSTEGNFVFLESVSDISKSVMQLLSYPFWRSRFENHFVICSRVNSTDFLPKLLEHIWNENILDFALVFVFEHLEVFSYNPFTEKKIINFTNYIDNNMNLFPDKLNNLNGFNLKVSIFDHPPSAVKINGKWRGRDIQQLEMVTSMMNATFTLTEHSKSSSDHFEEAYRSIREQKTQFCFVSHFHGIHRFDEAEFTYPHRTNALVLLLPITQDLKKKRNFLNIFCPATWFLILLLIATIFASIKLANRGGSSWVSFFHVWSAFLGCSIPNFRKNLPLAQYQLLLFIMMCLVFRTAFHCFLISSFVSPSYIRKITDISDLRDNDFTIYSGKAYARMMPPSYGLNHKLFFINKTLRATRLYNFDPSAAYLLTSIHAEAIMQRLKIRKKKVPYYILKMALVPGLDTYIFKKHSPFLEKINECLMKESQFGLWGNYVPLYPYSRSNQTSDDNIVLNMQHVRLVFYLLIVGLVISCFVFLIELIYINV